MNSIIQWMREVLPIGDVTVDKLLLTILIIGLLLILRWSTLRVALKRIDDPKAHYNWKKTATYFTFFLVVLLAGTLWIPTLTSLSTFLGLASAGIAVALRDPIVNLAGWGFILWRRPFEVGDRIQIGQVAGDVIDLRIFQFTVLEIGNWVDADQSTGRIIHVPNGKIFTEPQASFTKGFQYIWIEIPVLLTFESNWPKAKGLLKDIADHHGVALSTAAQRRVKEASKKFMIYYRNLTPIVYTSVRNSGVLLTIRCLSDPRKRRSIEESFWESILHAFSEHADIDFAYPTQRFFNLPLEGKEAHVTTSSSSANRPTDAATDSGATL
jgi:small-conductance mechanosensitive channel